MAPTTVYRACADRERIREVRPGTFVVPSFTDPDTTYSATPDGHCNCPRYEHRGNCIKHPFLAEQIQYVRSHRHVSRNAEETLVDLVMRIFAPIRKKRDTPAEALRLCEEVGQYYYSNERLRTAAANRHRRILETTG